jgi:hypothetical protein
VQALRTLVSVASDAAADLDLVAWDACRCESIRSAVCGRCAAGARSVSLSLQRRTRRGAVPRLWLCR